MTELTIRPSLGRFIGGVTERIRANRTVMIAAFAAMAGSLVSMVIMSRGTATPLLLAPALAILFVALLGPRVFYATFITLHVIDARFIERRGLVGSRRCAARGLNFVRYCIYVAPGLACKKYYLAIDATGRCLFTLWEGMWTEEDIERLAVSLGGEIRGSWASTMAVDLVQRTFGGPCEAW